MIKNDVYNHLKTHPKRLLHVINVAQIAKSLAQIYYVNEFDAYIAGLIHDYAKYDNNDFYLKYIDEETLNLYSSKSVTYHGFAAANYFLKNYEINNEIYLAVYNHVFGRIKMNLIEKIVYIADSIYLNGSRNSRYIYKTATIDLDLAVVLATSNTISYLERENLKPTDEQLQVLSYYKEQSNAKVK